MARKPLIGRDAELRAIDGLLDSVEAGKSPVAVVWGEPGIGKTSLIREAIERGSQRGLSTLSGRAAEYEQDLPLAVFSEAIARAVGASDLERLDLDESSLAALTRVLPFLGLSGAAPPEMDTRAPERHYVLRALHTLLESLAAENPLVLALDDLHWADSTSIDLVCRIVHHGIVHPSLLLLALRPGQAEGRLRNALWEAERHGQVTWLELHPLSTTESDTLLKGVGNRALRRLIYSETGGNPLYLEQLALMPKARAPIGDAPELGVPGAVSAAIRAETEALSETARTLLEGAAVAGDPFDQALATEAAALAARRRAERARRAGGRRPRPPRRRAPALPLPAPDRAPRRLPGHRRGLAARLARPRRGGARVPRVPGVGARLARRARGRAGGPGLDRDPHRRRPRDARPRPGERGPLVRGRGPPGPGRPRAPRAAAVAGRPAGDRARHRGPARRRRRGAQRVPRARARGADAAAAAGRAVRGHLQRAAGLPRRGPPDPDGRDRAAARPQRPRRRRPQARAGLHLLLRRRLDGDGRGRAGRARV